MPEIVNVRDFIGGIEAAARFIHGIWGKPANFPFYLDAVRHSSEPGKPLPMFFLMLEENNVIGCYGLITNDFISRHDLGP
jgi:hypothetical protein